MEIVAGAQTDGPEGKAARVGGAAHEGVEEEVNRSVTARGDEGVFAAIEGAGDLCRELTGRDDGLDGKGPRPPPDLFFNTAPALHARPGAGLRIQKNACCVRHTCVASGRARKVSSKRRYYQISN